MGFAIKGEHTPQYSFKTLEGLLAWLTRLDNEGYTTYYACASFREFQVWDEKQRKFVRRTHENFLAAAALWADVDTQESHANAKYVNRREAEQAILAFCQHVGLPPPLWVSSGGGLHVHWPLAAELELGEWQIYANGFRAACAGFGLAIDERKTVDGSAVLRVPGSHNYKFDPPRVVQAGEAVARYPLAQFAKLKELGLAQPARSRPVEQHSNHDSSIAATLIRTLYDDPSDPERTARACAQLAAFKGGPGNFSEPFHFGVAGLCKRSCDGGGDIYLSWLDPAYRDAGQTKLDNWHSDDPATCAYLESTSPQPELCKACPHYGKITTPCQLGRLAESKIERLAAARGQPIQLTTEQSAGLGAQAEADLNGFATLKPPWDIHKGKLVHISEDKKGELVIDPVADHPIYIDGEHTSEALGRVFCAFKHKPPNEPWCSIIVPAGDLSGSATKGLAMLADSGAHIRHNGRFLEYMRDQLHEWKSTHRYGMRFEQCGVKFKGAAFLAGSSLYRETGIEQVSVSDEVAIREKLGLGPRPDGDLREFRSTLNKLWKPDNYCAQFNLASSYGSVLHPLLNQNQGSVAIVNMSPESQTGKSVILYACAAIWGLWDALSLKDQDTAASVGLILASLGNLPAFVDEIQHFARHDVERLRAFLDLFTSGIDKHRALPYGIGVRIQTSRWLMTLLTSSNTSIIDIIQALGKAGSSDEAATNRYLELLWPTCDFDQSVGPELERHLWQHAGWAGHEFLKFIVRDDIQRHLKERLPDLTKSLWRRTSFMKEQRFRVNALGLAWAATEMLQEKGMGLECRIDEMVDWGVEQIRRRAPMTTAGDMIIDRTLQALDSFLRHNANNTLRVLTAYQKNKTQIPIGPRPQKVIIRHEQETARVYLVLHEFKTYCVQNGWFWSEIQESLLAQKIQLGARKMTLGAGTDYASVQTTCLEFDANHPVFSEALKVE